MWRLFLSLGVVVKTTLPYRTAAHKQPSSIGVAAVKGRVAKSIRKKATAARCLLTAQPFRGLLCPVDGGPVAATLASASAREHPSSELGITARES
jgi:hypothetical protein